MINRDPAHTNAVDWIAERMMPIVRRARGELKVS
jgi:hypothetical protein